MPFYPGFDTDAFPTLAKLQWLKSNTDLVWTGYYLGAAGSSHPATDWLGNRAALVAMGWGLAPLYVGEQEPTSQVRGNKNPSQAKGTTDGRETVALMTREGFPAGSTVYLDIEDGSLKPIMSEYVVAWIDAFNGSGFAPGIYCSHVIAGQAAALRPNAKPRIWAFKVTTTNGGPYNKTTFPNGDPAGSAYADAKLWQCNQNCTLALPGTPVNGMKVDLSTSVFQDPCAPAVVG